MKTLKRLLIELKACDYAIEWAQDRTIEQAVVECERADWILWLSEKVKCDKSKLVLSGGLCANTVRHIMIDERSRKGVDTAIYYGNGNATEQDLAAASYAARDAIRDGVWDGVVGAEYDAAWAITIAISWFDAASVYASASAITAARAAASYAARDATGDIKWTLAWDRAYNKAYDAALTQMSEIVKPIIGQELVQKVNNLLQ